MHQPLYAVPERRHPETPRRKTPLPWVFVHAIREYFDMPEVVRRTIFSSDRPSLTFNLVPSLLMQMDGYLNGEIEDVWLQVFKRPADRLSELEQDFIRTHFFSLNFKNFISPYPRFTQLYENRKNPLSPKDFRDVQVWWLLSQISVFKQREHPTIVRLLKKGRNFDEDDKSELLAIAMRTSAEALQLYRDLHRQNVIEVSTSPFYHPILPLLIDSDVAKVSMPEAPMPKRRFSYPHDAELHVKKALDFMESRGFKIVGMWPSEGAVSEAAIETLAKFGIEWAATDQGILERSGSSEHPYQVFEFKGVKLAFRDRTLSDLIGFTYHRMPTEMAVNDFVNRLAEIERKFGDDAVVFVILDGENAWPSYPYGGVEFLSKLYLELQKNFDLIAVREAVRKGGLELKQIFPGSWINSDFSMWIGERHKNEAWERLTEVRSQFNLIPESLAGEELMAAEGSDWFWWMGEAAAPFIAEFDEIFRTHLKAALEFAGKPMPESLDMPILEAAAAKMEFKPTGYISPHIDGKDTNFFEWVHAAELDFRKIRSLNAMVSGRLLLRKAFFGFDDRFLFVRIDAAKEIEELLEDHSIEVELAAEHRKVILRFTKSQNEKVELETESVDVQDVRWAVGKILEIAVPKHFLGETKTYLLKFRLMDQNGILLESHPPSGWFKVSAVPDEWPV